MHGRDVLLYLLLTSRLGLVSSQVLRQALRELASAHSLFNRETLLRALEENHPLNPEKTRLLTGLVNAAREIFGGDTDAVLATLGGMRAVNSLLGSGLKLSGDGVFIHQQEVDESDNDNAVTPEAQGRYSWLDERGALTEDESQALLGRGGIGRVLRAFDHHLGREVAVKELMLQRDDDKNPDGAMDASLKATLILRFVREARVTGQLEHPNIVPTYELGRRADGTLYYTMKVVRGKTLAKAIAGASNLAERLKLLPRFVDLCQAIAYAHSHGVMHRDIKPQNVMVGQFGQTVVLDWGLAKLQATQESIGGGGSVANRESDTETGGESPSGIQLPDDFATVAGTHMGTPAYMSPEQARGEFDAVDERSDIFSLGAVLRVLILGRPVRRVPEPEEELPTMPPRDEVPTIADDPERGAAAAARGHHAQTGEGAGATGATRPDVISRGALAALESEGGVDNELVSICEKAMRMDRAGRYRNASELADDVEAYLTGARVSTYEYRTWELLLRFAREHRRVIGVVGAALVLLVSFAVYDQVKIRTERNRALRAERSARQAERVERHRRAEAQQEGARSALVAGRLMEARAKLRASLEIRDSIGARALWWRLARRPLYWSRSLSAAAYSVEFSPDGQRLAVGSTDTAIYILDRLSGRVLSVLRGHREQVMRVAYSPDGKILASVGWGGELLLWNVATSTLRRRIKVQGGGISGLAFHPSGKFVATGGDDGMVRIWRVGLGDEPQVTVSPRLHTRRLLTLAFSSDGHHLASAGDDRQIVIWEVALKKKGLRVLRRLKGHRASVKDLRFGAGGRKMISASADGEVRLWDARSWTSLRTLKGNHSMVFGVDISADGALLVSTGLDNKVRLWDGLTGTIKRIFHTRKGSLRSARIDPRGEFVATVGEDHVVRLWSVRGGVDREPPPGGHRGSVVGVALGAKYVATGGADGTVRLWDPRDGRELTTLTGHVGRIHGVAFSPDGKLLASVGNDRIVRLWDVGKRRLRFRLYGHSSTIYGVGFSPDGKTLATGGTNNELYLWDVGQGRKIGALQGHTSTIVGLGFDPTGQVLASASADKTLRVWQWPERKLMRVLKGHTGLVWSARFGGSAEKLYSGAEDHTIRRWDVQTGEGEIIHRSKSRMGWIDVNGSGTLLAAPLANGKLLLVDPKTRLSWTLEGHQAELAMARFGPDGQRIVTGGDDGTVRLWQVTPPRALWHVPALLDDPPRFYFNGSWRSLATSKPLPTSSRAWERRVGQQGYYATQHLPSHTLCLITANKGLEIWDSKRDRRLVSVDAPKARDVVALRRACLLRDGDKLRRIDTAGLATTLSDGVSAATSAGSEIYYATGDRIVRLAPGRSRWSLVSGPSVTAIGVLSGSLAAGYREGNISLFDLRTREQRRDRVFESTPASAVLRLIRGPGGTLIGGFADGMVGVWNPATGELLHRVKLHGPIKHLRMHKNRLLMASELGQARSLDLAAFSVSYCDLMHTLWAKVPVVWSSHQPMARPRPSKHPCAQPRPATR